MSSDPLRLPRVVSWRAGFGDTPGLFDYLGEQGGATLAVAFAALFWPRFVEERGCVLLAEQYDAERFQEWWTQLDGECRAIEATINHLHLWDVIDPDAEDVPPEAMRHLAAVLAKTWRAALREQWPDREFDVSITDEPDDYGPTITVARDRQGEACASASSKSSRSRIPRCRTSFARTDVEGARHPRAWLSAWVVVEDAQARPGWSFCAAIDSAERTDPKRCVGSVAAQETVAPAPDAHDVEALAEERQLAGGQSPAARTARSRSPISCHSIAASPWRRTSMTGNGASAHRVASSGSACSELESRAWARHPAPGSARACGLSAHRRRS